MTFILRGASRPASRDQTVADSVSTPVLFSSMKAGVVASPGQSRPAGVRTPLAPQKLGPGGSPFQRGVPALPSKWLGAHDLPPSNDALTMVWGTPAGAQASPSAIWLTPTANVSLSTAYPPAGNLRPQSAGDEGEIPVWQQEVAWLAG